jgi:hypothetical protein
MRKLPHWLEELSPSESIDLYRELAASHAREGGPIGARILRLIERDDLRGLCEFEMSYRFFGVLSDVVLDYLRVKENPLEDDIIELYGEDAVSLEFVVPEHDDDRHAIDPDELQRLEALFAARVSACRQALAFFQKVEHLEIGVDKEEVAFGKFLEAEELCKESNAVFRAVRRGEFQFSQRVAGVLHSAQQKIARVLGRVPSIGELNLRFGPGATRGTKRKDASVRRKLAERLQCSEDLFPAASYVLEEMPPLVDIHSVLDRTDEDGHEWSRVELEVIPAKLSFVPKNAKTYRSICSEPGLNVIVQAGYGAWMAKRLAAFGVDIRDQTVNQRRAKEGSLTGALATLDLSSASDTISREIVYELLPLDWAVALNRARSSKVLLPTGQVLRQEKFSSMGNGFTFPLETLIFWGLASACCSKEKDATVYGDDIIVPSNVYPLLVEVLVAVGFEVNLKKSYATGLFRESCGKDYVLGTDVRPYYPRGWVSGQSLFVLHNFYVRRGDLERAERVLKFIHPALQIFGPDGFGDGHLLGDHPRRRPLKYDLRGYCGYFFDTYVTRTSKDAVPLERGEYVVSLYSIYRRSAEDWEFLPLVQKGMSSGDPYWLKYQHRGLGTCGPAPLPLPEGKDGVKALPLPGVAGYKKITVYTLRG